jgi:hypothetical protein
MNVYVSYHLIRQEKIRFILHLSFLYRIRDDKKGRIRDKHPGSATLFKNYNVDNLNTTNCSGGKLRIYSAVFGSVFTLRMRVRNNVLNYDGQSLITGTGNMKRMSSISGSISTWISDPAFFFPGNSFIGISFADAYPGSGMTNFRIRIQDKHSGSATLLGTPEIQK